MADSVGNEKESREQEATFAVKELVSFHHNKKFLSELERSRSGKFLTGAELERSGLEMNGAGAELPISGPSRDWGYPVPTGSDIECCLRFIEQQSIGPIARK